MHLQLASSEALSNYFDVLIHICRHIYCSEANLLVVNLFAYAYMYMFTAMC
jgi:hypothetical protein